MVCSRGQTGLLFPYSLMMLTGFIAVQHWLAMRKVVQHCSLFVSLRLGFISITTD